MLTAETGLGSNPGLPSETPSTLHCWRCDGRTVEASARRFEAPCDRTEVKRSSQIGSDKRWAAYLSSPSVCMADRLAPEHLRDVSTTLHHQSALNVALPRHLPRKHGFTYSQGADSARAHTHTQMTQEPIETSGSVTTAPLQTCVTCNKHVLHWTFTSSVS